MPDYLLGSRASLWRVPGTILEVATTFSFTFLVAKPFHVGSDVDGLACFLHHPTVCGWQRWVQCFLIGATPFYHATVVDGAFLRGAKPPWLDIYHSVDRLGPWWTDFFVEKPALIGAHSFNVRVIVVIMRVLIVERLCQSLMGHIAVLECLLPRGAWVSAVLSYHARYSILIPFVGPSLQAFPSAESPRVWLLGARVHSLLGYEDSP
jgi:hypothetical protein